MTDNQPAYRRGSHYLAFRHTPRQAATKLLSQIGMLKNQSALQIFAGVEAASEAKVAL